MATGATLVGYSADNYPIVSDGKSCFIDYTVDGSGPYTPTQCPASTTSSSFLTSFYSGGKLTAMGIGFLAILGVVLLTKK
jgi:hypothetical protein